MKRLIIATALALSASGGAALAQSLEAPAGTAPTTAPGTVTTAPDTTGTVAPRGEVVPARPLNDPNSTGPDKVNGLDVPQMKGEPPAAR